MLRPDVLVANFVVVSVSLLVWPGAISQTPETVIKHSPTAAVEPRSSPLVLELDRAIGVLQRGLKEGWETRDQYLAAFEKTPSADSTGSSVRKAKDYARCAISAHLQTHRIWDEGPPLAVEVEGAIRELARLRNEYSRKAKDVSSNSNREAAVLRLPPCTVTASRRVALSPGVAAGLLRSKIDPVYPAHGHVSGTVVLHALISAEGRVVALRAVSGNPFLFQPALEAARQWTYRPYQLNNTAVEFETTINVVFLPRRP